MLIKTTKSRMLIAKAQADGERSYKTEALRKAYSYKAC